MMRARTATTTQRSVGFCIALALSLGSASAEHTVMFNDCDVGTYYSYTNVVMRDEMHALLRTTHRNIVPYSATGTDIWDAIIDLDSDSSGNFVQLVYKNEMYDALPVAEVTSWNREHLWPKEQGVGFSGPDHSDLHAIRPAHWYNKAERYGRYFSSCGVHGTVDQCVSPATQIAHIDTETDGKTFKPPANKKGDIARALFYMATRYDGDEDDTVNLVLSDCPEKPADSDTTVEYGLLSQLLKWHEEDPPDTAERIRNEKACEYWQGNRNPFIDYPELVQWYFGLPRDVVAEGQGYDCTVSNPPGENPGKVTLTPTKAPTPTLSPTAAPTSIAPTIAPTTATPTAAPTTATPSTTPSVTPTSSPSLTPSVPPTATPTSAPTPIPVLGTCNGLTPGDVMFAGFNSDGANAIAMVAFTEIRKNTAIYMTTSAWDETTQSFLSDGGVEKFLAPSTGIVANTIIGYGSTSLPYKNEWTTESGSFGLSEEINTMFLYCYDSVEAGSTPVVLSALTYDWNGWATSPNSAGSVFPTAMPEYTHIQLSHLDNYIYVGEKEGSQMDVLKKISDPNMWEGSNHARHELSSTLGTFNISP